MIPRRRSLYVVAPLLGLALLASACRGLAAPQGWGAPVVTPTGTITGLHKGTVALTDANGNVVWQFPTANDKQTKLQGVYGTPAVVGNTVVFGAYDGNVYALDLASGKPIWPSFHTGDTIVGSVAANSSAVYVGNSAGQVYGLDITTGKPLPGWQHPFQTGERIWSSPVLDSGTVYVTSMDRKVYALDATSGQVRWKNGSADGAVASTPVLANGLLFFGSFDKHLYAVDPSQSGAQKWISPAGDNWFWTTAAVGGSTVYAGNLDGSLYAFSTGDGHLLWKSKVGDSIRGTPALVNGLVLAADRSGKVAGFKTDTGAPAWPEIDLQSNTLGDLVVNSDGLVLAVTEGGKLGSRLVQIDPQTGKTADLEKP